MSTNPTRPAGSGEQHGPDRVLVEALEAIQRAEDGACRCVHGQGYTCPGCRIDAALARYREASAVASAVANTPGIPDGCAASPIIAPLPPSPTLTPALLEQIGEEARSWREGFAVATAGMDARRPTVREWCSTAEKLA